MPGEVTKTHIRRFVAKADRSVVSGMTSKATHIGEFRGIPPPCPGACRWLGKNLSVRRRRGTHRFTAALCRQRVGRARGWALYSSQERVPRSSNPPA